MATPEEMSMAQAIVTQAYSRLKNGLPGPGNENMAATVRGLYEKYHLPIIPQEEVAMAAPDLPCLDIAGGSPDGRSTVSWNTWTVAVFQAEKCKKNGWKIIIVVVVPIGVGRAKWCYEQLGLKPLMAPPSMKDAYHPDLVHFSARKKWRITAREVFCRILFLIWGRI